jgi:hypothetical protein
MGWFGPSKDEVWRQLSEEIGAEFVEGGFWMGSKVQAQVGPWTITLDSHNEDVSQLTPLLAPFVRPEGCRYTIHRKKHFSATRLRAPYVNPEGFRFTIYHKGFFSNLGKLLGMRDIEVGDPDFDEAFIIKGNDEDRVRQYFSDPKIRQMIQAQPKIRLEVKDSEGWFGPKFPEDVHELHFEVVGVIKDVKRLNALFDLFAAVLDQECRIGSASKQEAGVEL